MSPHDSIGNKEANQSTNSKVKGSPNDEAGKSPTISQIMRDFDLKWYHKTILSIILSI